ncbi:hypothetical protein Asppvi_005786 [Aspergillus pseudoviridinutans]|uniref:Glycosyl hydrolase family 71-domain-containing protein n=1 Tax=Aspergillus pseudoviridinutans TaxID=1517512 RepID=A0A9P3EVB3_9EURO|nr:uncharacterized protein Asppvi_005786 [Aspergillus pseudoviridinutans]GIJ86888.1 hypothetical protein Asppvi_005786 [Aspergillus pseudoviridinutans]
MAVTAAYGNTSIDRPLFNELRVVPYENYPKSVFAHFMVSNVQSWTQTNWENEIKLAKDAHIDAFALNIASNQAPNSQVWNAFAAAEAVGFKLFFSFDYAGNGPWAKEDVISYLQRGIQSSAYFIYREMPFVSTFEGPASAPDWVEIKKEIPCWFVPDWSSLGASQALRNSPGVANGLFNWGAWPWGNTDMDTYVDASYLEFLGDNTYMMPISPWFFTNLPGYNKNWLWRGDDLWFDRWEQAMFVKPDLIEIITWNDYGESHYIGPLHDEAYDAFDVGNAPFNFAKNMPHDGWRLFLPFLIDMYKHGQGLVTQEGLQVWYRLTPGNACASGNTSGNTAQQLQIEFPPAQVMQDKVFFSALLTSPADVTVTIGGVAVPASWSKSPSKNVGIYHGSVAYNGLRGKVVVTISRNGQTIAQVDGEPISSECAQSVMNWNAWVGSASAPSLLFPAVGPNIYNQNCTQGTGVGGFKGLCEFTCSLGYCPIGACQCLKMGPPPKLPPATGQPGYPLAGESESFRGLCSFACNYGYCPPSACGPTIEKTVIPTVSPFLPPACTGGTGEGNWMGLCSYACNYGYCPEIVCTCTSTGVLNLPPPTTNNYDAYPVETNLDGGLCKFACQRGYCPSSACVNFNTTGSGLPPTTPLEECDATFSSLEDLANSASTIPFHCQGQYTLAVLSQMWDTVLKNYTDLVNGGYDGYFLTYSDAVAKYGSESVHNYMYDNGDKYFTCIVTEAAHCCKACGQGRDCNYCFDGDCYKNCPARICSRNTDLSIPIIKMVNASEPCPPNYSKRGPGPDNPYVQSVYWTLESSQSDNFYADLLNNTGIPKDKITFGNYERGNTCPPSAKPDDDCWGFGMDFGIPIPHDYTASDVTNPKDLIQKAVERSSNLGSQLQDTLFALSVDAWIGDTSELIDAVSMPVLMMAEAVEQMATVVDLAKKIDAEKRKMFILTFLGVFFLLLPIAGEVLEVGELGVIMDLVSLGGNTGLDVYTIVDDPHNAPLAIMNLIFVPAALSDVVTISKAANLRRGMDDLDIAKLGDRVAGRMGLIKKVTGSCSV